MKPPIPQHVWIVMLDIHEFCERPDPMRVLLRENLRRLVATALEVEHLDSDQLGIGDGRHSLTLFFPSQTTPFGIVGGLARRLHEGLRELGGLYSREARIRLRMAVHHGMATQDEAGWTGTATDVTARLVDSPVLHRMMNAGDGIDLAVIISEDFFNTVVRPGHRSLDPDTFVAVPSDQGQAWVHVPGHRTPPGLAEGPRDRMLISPLPAQRRIVLSGLAGLVAVIATMLALTHEQPPQASPPTVVASTPKLELGTGVTRAENQNWHPDRNLDLDDYGRDPVPTDGLPRHGYDIAFSRGQLWAGEGTMITDVPTSADLDGMTCYEATGYTSRGLLDPPRAGRAYCLRTDEKHYWLLIVTGTPSDPAGPLKLDMYSWG